MAKRKTKTKRVTKKKTRTPRTKVPVVTVPKLLELLRERVQGHRKGYINTPIKYNGAVSINATKGAVAELEWLIAHFELQGESS